MRREQRLLWFIGFLVATTTVPLLIHWSSRVCIDSDRLMMELGGIEIGIQVEMPHEGTQSQDKRDRVQVGRKVDNRKTGASNRKHFSFSEKDEDTSPTLLEVSMDTSSGSILEQGGGKDYNEGYIPMTNSDCVADKVVRFFCPFDEYTYQATEEHTIQEGEKLHPRNKSILKSPSHDCTGDWLKPVQTICIPKEWEDSPERPGPNRINIRNRKGAFEENERSEKYIRQLRKQWHPSTPQVPLREVASFKGDIKRQSDALDHPSTPSVYYDSDPEGTATTPKYRKNRPKSLSLNLDDLDIDVASELSLPRVPRHSSQKLKSFFDESPRSVVDMLNFDDEDGVRAFIKVSISLIFTW